ncbi:CCR4-NOT transcription complex subunit 3 [Echinococcus granulosus]|uniref:CCR4 NOT transcription complex subunit 3 n=1 Tax=Echinococcus granulosus TaxID=6210 RepID=A0A068WCN6_ECHGR|nr:CCR4-NOT transcription complex subunit 3 [Echinococcus granulosus]CDS16184.1 CCR4 NOT transcription complex subunit 3 [Echinococcus granulosus]
MADKRKLQCDIDRTLKRVQEGRVAFQEILDKFEGSNNQTQKEKFEADLKKEIKRLQRFRDQIKTWHTCNDIKDKRPLLEARKLIEMDMERFKVIEKETKTKAYSKEGLLSADAKKDPLQKEKEELDEWLKQSISALQTKSERYEYDLETLSTTGKKKRVDKEKAALLEEKKQKLEFCAYHIEKLETVMRHLDNERLDCSKVRSLKDPIEYVIESIDDVSMEDYRSLYEDMHLEDIGDVALSTATKAGNDDDPTLFSSSLPPGSSTSSNASSRERPKTSLEEKCIFNPTSLSSTSTPVKEKKEKSAKSQPASASVNQTLPSSFHLPGSSTATPSSNKKSFAGAAAKHQQPEAIKPEFDRLTVPIPDSAPIHRENYAKVAGDLKKDKSKKELHQQYEFDPKTVISSSSATPTKNEKRKVEEAKERAQSSDSAVSIIKLPSPTHTPSVAVDVVSVSVAPPLTSVSLNSVTSKSSASTSQALTTANVAPAMSKLQQEQRPSPAPFVLVHPRDALAPFRNQHLDKQRTLPPELRAQLQALEIAFRRSPLPTDIFKSRMLVTKRPINVPSFFPLEPFKGHDLEEYYMKMDAQTLFFIFYYFEGTRAQYFAAKALKRMSWRFHTKYMYWFQRNEEPKQITEEFESGAYVFYDFETMSQRKKDEFVFLYSFLEDNDL